MFFRKKNSPWNTNYREFKKNFRDNKDYNTILTDKLQMSLNTFKTRKNNHMVVLGGNGSGKHRFVVLPNLLQANCNYVVNDMDGEMYHQTKDFFKEQGYNVKVIDFKNPDNSQHYNPFYYFNNEEDIKDIVNCLTAEIEDKFIKDTARILLLAVCWLLIEYCSMSPHDISLLDIYRLVEGMDIKDKEKCEVSKLMHNIKPNSKADIYWKLFNSMSDVIKMETIVNIILQLKVLDKYNFIFYEYDSLNIEDFTDNKTILFIISNDVNDKVLINLINMQVFNSLSKIAEKQDNQKLPIHTRFILNEWNTISPVYNNFLEKVFIFSRRKELSVMILVHDIMQFKAIYGKDWEMTMDNCDTLLFLGCSGQSTLEYIRELFRYAGVQGSPEQDLSRCMVFIRGVKPFYDKKYNPIYHKNYKYLNN